MSNFYDRLSAHLSSKLDLPLEQILVALDSFGNNKQTESTKPIQVGKDSLIQHKCERPPRGKTHACGKPAANEITFPDGSVHRYCGTPKKGCTRTILAELEKTENSKVKKSKSPVKRKSSDPKPKNGPKEEILALLNKQRIVPVHKPQIKKIDSKSGELWIHGETRILFNKIQRSRSDEDSTVEAYGLLDKDESIKPLGNDEKKWLEKQRIPIADETIDESNSDSDDDLDLNDI